MTNTEQDNGTTLFTRKSEVLSALVVLHDSIHPHHKLLRGMLGVLTLAYASDLLGMLWEAQKTMALTIAFTYDMMHPVGGPDIDREEINDL